MSALTQIQAELAASSIDALNNVQLNLVKGGTSPCYSNGTRKSRKSKSKKSRKSKNKYSCSPRPVNPCGGW